MAKCVLGGDISSTTGRCLFSFVNEYSLQPAAARVVRVSACAPLLWSCQPPRSTPQIANKSASRSISFPLHALFTFALKWRVVKHMGDDDDDGLDGACVLRGLELLFCCFSPYRPQPRFVRERVRERESVRVEGVVKKQRQGRALRLSSLQYSPHYKIFRKDEDIISNLKALQFCSNVLLVCFITLY